MAGNEKRLPTSQNTPSGYVKLRWQVSRLAGSEGRGPSDVHLPSQHIASGCGGPIPVTVAGAAVLVEADPGTFPFHLQAAGTNESVVLGRGGIVKGFG